MTYIPNENVITNLLTNGRVETGDLSCWTVGAGSKFAAVTISSGGHTPPFGSYLCNKGSGGNGNIYQDVDLSSEATAIDAGNVYAFSSSARWDANGSVPD
ncbi:hypothetical protein [Sphingomicrobium arenosum]|uniref:hypothetical protein n=1 Tax=Sphingomicrobium arenosum TaxID=2233861 RepID=UPI0022410327|nr:hypothetical protein [Sphingomicrobium arenosum]